MLNKIARLSHCLLPVVSLALVFVVSQSGRSEQRTWNDKSGKFSVEAELVKFDDQTVTLKTTADKTITVALSKLSAQDIEYLNKQVPVKGEESEIRLTTMRFFNALRKSDEERVEQVREVVTAKAREQLEGSGSEIKNLPKPDRSAKPAVRTIDIDGDTAAVIVRLRLKGASILPTLLLRKEGDSWLAYGLVGPDENDEEQTILFEGKDGGSSSNNSDSGAAAMPGDRAGLGGGDAGVGDALELGDGQRGDKRGVDDAMREDGPDREDNEAEQGDAEQGGHGGGGHGGGAQHGGHGAPDQASIQVPEGNPRQLLRFIDQTLASKPKSGNTPDHHRQQVALAVEEAAQRILRDRSASSAESSQAGRYLVDSAMMQFEGHPEEHAERIQDMPEELARRGLDDVVPYATSAALIVDLTLSPDLAATQQAIDRVVAHLGSAPLTKVAGVLARKAADASESLGTDYAAQTHTKIGKILAQSSNDAIVDVGAALIATGRRLGLVGSEMKVTGVTIDGGEFDWSDFDGKVVLVDFWATWCGPCREAMPSILKHYQNYNARGFEVVAISVDDDLGALEEYLDEEKPPWTVLADEHRKNKESSLAKYYGIGELPTTILIGVDGNVISLEAHGKLLDSQLAEIFADTT